MWAFSSDAGENYVDLNQNYKLYFEELTTLVVKNYAAFTFKLLFWKQTNNTPWEFHK